MPDIRSYGPGKFNTLIDEAVYHLAADGADEELAEVGFGSRQLLRGGPDLSEAIPHAQTPLNDAEVDFLTRQIGAILTETSDGFITVDYYEDPELLDDAWAQVREDFSDFAGAEEDMDQDAATESEDIPLP